MKVAYDLSIVGLGFTETYLRTGVFRYAFELALALAGRSDICLEFAATRHIHLAREALSQISELRGVPLVRPSYAHFRSSLSPLLESDRLTLPKRSAKFTTLDAMTLHVCVHILRKLLPKFAPAVAPQTLSGAGIFHSPWFGFPLDLPRRKGLHRFLSILDLIPIRFPYLFSGEEEMDLRRKISRIAPEDFVVCISSQTREDLLNFRSKLDSTRVFVTYPGVSDEFAPVTDEACIEEIRSKIGVPKGSRYILSLCTLEPRKNLGLLMRAFAALAEEGYADDTYLVLAGGEGWQLELLSKQLKEVASMKKQILLTGRMDDEDLPALYSGAIAFAYPSLYEGFGLPPLEAMRCGTPVVVSRTSSLPEVVGDAGLYCDPRDYESLAQALQKVLCNADLRRSLQTLGLEQSRQFSWTACANATVDAYKLALES